MKYSTNASMKYSTDTTTDNLQKLVDVSTQRWISMNQLFDHADADRSGGVTKDEMQDLLDEVHLSVSVNFDTIWDALDKDKNGKVTWEEWHKCFSGIVPSSGTDTAANQSITWSIKPSYRDDVP